MAMTMAEKFYADNNMVSVPPRPCDFKVGDVVKFTNDYGVEFQPHKVIGFTTPENEQHGRFIDIDTDAPWFPVKPESLTKICDGYRKGDQVVWNDPDNGICTKVVTIETIEYFDGGVVRINGELDCLISELS